MIRVRRVCGRGEGVVVREGGEGVVVVKEEFVVRVLVKEEMVLFVECCAMMRMMIR